jgi:hypothetical protein
LVLQKIKIGLGLIEKFSSLEHLISIFQTAFSSKIILDENADRVYCPEMKTRVLDKGE